MLSVEKSSERVKWPMVRVKGGHDVEVVVPHLDMLRVATHYVGRTLMCSEEEDCPVCQVLPTRVYWYLPVWVEALRRWGVLELSGRGSVQLEQVVRFESGGCVAPTRVRLSRRSQKAPVYSEALGAGEVGGVPTHQAFWSAVMVVFGMPGVLEDETLPVYSGRIRPRVVARCEAAAATVAKRRSMVG